MVLIVADAIDWSRADLLHGPSHWAGLTSLGEDMGKLEDWEMLLDMAIPDALDIGHRRDMLRKQVRDAMDGWRRQGAQVLVAMTELQFFALVHWNVGFYSDDQFFERYGCYTGVIARYGRVISSHRLTQASGTFRETL